MHKLTRGLEPTCLKKYRRRRKNNWRKVTSDDKDEIWEHLNQMQQQRCAYCENSIEKESRHIEHFRQHSRYPQGMFEWENLFGSCIDDSSCGRHKDSLPEYPLGKLIKPDCEDPEDFLLFSPDGEIKAKSGLSPKDIDRVKYTICIFNLNSPFLMQRRKGIAIRYTKTAGGLNKNDWLEFVKREIAAVEREHLPFATTIKHLLLPA